MSDSDYNDISIEYDIGISDDENISEVTNDTNISVDKANEDHNITTSYDQTQTVQHSSSLHNDQVLMNKANKDITSKVSIDKANDDNTSDDEQDKTPLLDIALTEAIVNEDKNRIEKLLLISDYLHKGAPTYEGFKQSDLASDMKYEEAKKKLSSLMSLDATISLSKINSQSSTKSDIKLRKTKERINDTLMFMDGIQIVEQIPSINDAILMPKFDGCSIAVELVAEEDNEGYKYFVITKAHTRGSDNLTGTRKCQDKTEYIKEVFNDKVNEFNKIFNKLQHKDKPVVYNLEHKDINLLGNVQPTLYTDIDIRELDYVLLRGEFVSNNKHNIKTFDEDRVTYKDYPTTNIGLSSGAINSDYDKFIKYKDYITYIPFEIAQLRTKTVKKNGTTEIKAFIPSQQASLSMLRSFKLIAFKEVIVKHIDHNFNMENVLKRYEKELMEPLDGIVYCSKHWTYPNTVEESGKRVNYGKYKYKRENKKQTKLISIEYTIGKTGKINPSFIFDNVKISDKNYKQAKTTFNRIEEFIEQAQAQHSLFGKNTICELELKSDISPYITKIYPSISKNVKEISLIKKCPYCGNVLYREEKSNGKAKENRIINVFCTNDKCIGINVERCSDFLKQLGYKGISSKTLYNMEYSSFKDLYDTKLDTSNENTNEVGKKDKIIYSSKSMKQRMTKEKNKKISFDSLIENVTSKNFLIITSLMTKKQANDYIENNDINDDEKLLYTLANNDKYKKLLLSSNHFIKDLTKFIITEYIKQ